MKPIGPDHPITVTPHPGRVRVTFEGRPVADSADVLVLREASYPPVFYFPRADVAMSDLVRTEHSTHCPYKGDANYFSLVDKDVRADNAVWTYEHPGTAVAAIAGHLAFYPSRVEIEAL